MHCRWVYIVWSYLCCIFSARIGLPLRSIYMELPRCDTPNAHMPRFACWLIDLCPGRDWNPAKRGALKESKWTWINTARVFWTYCSAWQSRRCSRAQDRILDLWFWNILNLGFRTYECEIVDCAWYISKSRRQIIYFLSIAWTCSLSPSPVQTYSNVIWISLQWMWWFQDHSCCHWLHAFANLSQVDDWIDRNLRDEMAGSQMVDPKLADFGSCSPKEVNLGTPFQSTTKLDGRICTVETWSWRPIVDIDV